MAERSPEVLVIPAGFSVRFLNLLKRTFVGAFDDGCFGIAKGAAYSSLLAFFPAMASLTAILAQVQAESMSRMISRFLFELAPQGSQDLVRFVFTERGQRPLWLLIVSSTLSIWAATGAVMSLMEGFQAAYKLPGGRPFLKQRGVAVLLVFAAAAPSLGATSLMLFGNRTERMILQWLHLLPQGDQFQWWVVLIGRSFRYATALAATVLVTGLLYHFGPNRPAKKLREVWPGAILATVLWLPATAGFGWYVGHIANYNVLYGSVAAGIVLLIWMYLLAVIALVGCEFNAEWARKME
ncbi:MAG TPA: YihY/virulence factor BrkB family protein [Bryobacteraceae bacterium]|nr:YihY/virulence factor BrkB family protein [Bryobacteraceae bacterium]